MTRSEEELRVGTAERETGRARLRKYVVEDEVTQTVPVRREEVRVEREPITDANVGDATSGPDISEEEHEVVLHEEEVVDREARRPEGARPARQGHRDGRARGLRDRPQGAGRGRRGEPAEGRDGVRGPTTASPASALATQPKELHMSLFAAVNVGDSLQQGLDSFFGFLPNLLGFLVILFVGYIVARVVKGILTKVLDNVGLDRALHSGQTGQYVEKVSPGASPSKLVGAIAFWFIFLGAISLAVSALKIPALTTFVSAIYGYLPNVIAAVIIFVVAGAIAGAVAALVTKTMGDTPTGKLVASVVPVLIMAIATFMILNQLQIAPEIVTITYAVLLGSLGLGMALAFGLGGRETAAQLVSGAYDKGQEQKGQVKQDMRTGKERGEQQAQQAKDKAQQSDGRPPAGALPAR